MFDECIKCNERAPGCQTRCPYYKKNKEKLERRNRKIKEAKEDYRIFKDYKESRFNKIGSDNE